MNVIRYLICSTLLFSAPTMAYYSEVTPSPPVGKLTIKVTGACKFKRTYDASITAIRDSKNSDPNAYIIGAINLK